MDLLGYGLSDKPSITYTNNLFEQLVGDFIKNVIGKKTSVVATGESVPFVIMACHNNPEIFNKIICINPQSLYLQIRFLPDRQAFSNILLNHLSLAPLHIIFCLTEQVLKKHSIKNTFFIRKKSGKNIFITI